MAMLSTVSAMSPVVFLGYENLWRCLCKSFFGSMCFITESPINTTAFVFLTSLLLELFTLTQEFASVCEVSDVFCQGSWALLLEIFWLSASALTALGFFFFGLLTSIHSSSLAVQSLVLLALMESVERLPLSSEDSILITSRKLAFSFSRWSIVDS